jgi:chaperonin GroEL
MVVKQAVSNATSVASSLITTEVVITDEPKKDEPAGGAGSGMPGMGDMY